MAWPKKSRGPQPPQPKRGQRGPPRKPAARLASKSARGPGDKRAKEGPRSVGEAIGQKFLRLLSGGAARALHSVPLPLLGAPDAELRDATLLGLDQLKLRPEVPTRIVRSDKYLIVRIPLQVQDLKVTGQYTTLRSHVTMKGMFKARLQHLHIYIEIAICSSRPKLQTLEVTKMEGLRITSAKGMTIFLNWVLVALIDSFVNRNQARIFRIIRETLWKAFAMHVLSVLPRLDVRYISKKHACQHGEQNKA